ncbi:MAG TPA: hypothetical protein VGL61_01725 [Kofleriaceae bacterium]|jgi:hypothetical protein
MRTIIIAALLASASCTTAPESHQDVLADDAYYIIVTPQCTASGDLELCAFELGFCTDGTYSAVLAGGGEAGTYTILHGLAVDDANSFEFDFTTQQIIEPGTTSTTPWSVATADDNTLVACGD